MAKSRKSESKSTAKALHLGVLIDESGSMAHNQAAVIGGFNELIGSLSAKESETRVRASLAMFDLHGDSKPVRVKFADIPLEEVRPLTDSDYSPRGVTPLNDAVVKTIRAIGKRVRKGERVMLVILTDGLENASETSTAEVRRLIAKREAEGWEFIYLGANHDVWAESQKIGLAKKGKAMAWEASPAGASAAMRMTADRVAIFRDDADEYETSAESLPDSIPEDYRRG